MDASCDIHSLSFSPWAIPTNTLLDIVAQMMEECNILKENRGMLKEFLLTVQSTYNQNPFHGWLHAVSVTQMMHLFITKPSIAINLSAKEKYALIIAALCHDLDHPGLSNTFQINSKSPLFGLYGSKSVLENHHYAVCMTILKQQEAKVLSNFEEEERQQIYALIRSLILGTDMANHFALLEEFNKIVENFQWSNPHHRAQLLTMLMKAADISNEARPFNVSKMWASALMEEYFNQSDLEKERKLPVTPFMDREKVKVPQTQVNFIDSFLLPTFKVLQRVVPELQSVIDVIDENRRKWTEAA